jgi:hypothetical protein
MLEPSSRPDFAQEALIAERCCQLGVEHLQRHVAVVAEVVGEIYRSHAAAPELALNAVAVS